MGGRLDSTNIFPAPLVTAITSIGLDHQQFLGPDLRSIAGEKAGILKEGVPCVLGVLPPEARSVVLERSMRLGVEVYDGLPDPAASAGPEWLQRNRAVARRILALVRAVKTLTKPCCAADLPPGASGDAGNIGVDGLILDCAHNVEGLTATGKALAALNRPLRIVYAPWPTRTCLRHSTAFQRQSSITGARQMSPGPWPRKSCATKRLGGKHRACCATASKRAASGPARPPSWRVGGRARAASFTVGEALSRFGVQASVQPQGHCNRRCPTGSAGLWCPRGRPGRCRPGAAQCGQSWPA